MEFYQAGIGDVDEIAWHLLLLPFAGSRLARRISSVEFPSKHWDRWTKLNKHLVNKYQIEIVRAQEAGIKYLQARSESNNSVSASFCGQSYKQFTLVIYNSRVVIWGIFKSGTTLES